MPLDEGIFMFVLRIIGGIFGFFFDLWFWSEIGKFIGLVLGVIGMLTASLATLGKSSWTPDETLAQVLGAAVLISIFSFIIWWHY